VRSDERFVRDGDDLHTAVRLTMTEAALGTRTRVSAPGGDLDLDVGAGTQPGEVRVIRGEGMPSLQGRRGDLYVRLDVAVPTPLTDEQRAPSTSSTGRRARDVCAEGRRRGVLPSPEERASLSDLRRVSFRVPADEAEAARARLLDLAPAGFEEVEGDGWLELALYADEAGEGRARAAFGDVAVSPVEAGWEDRWRSFHRSVVVGGLWVGPPWEHPPDGVSRVVVDPGRAFGTGAHPTTRACIELWPT
jgi:hypothetical protein